MPYEVDRNAIASKSANGFDNINPGRAVSDLSIRRTTNSSIPPSAPAFELGIPTKSSVSQDWSGAKSV